MGCNNKPSQYVMGKPPSSLDECRKASEIASSLLKKISDDYDKFSLEQSEYMKTVQFIRSRPPIVYDNITMPWMTGDTTTMHIIYDTYHDMAIRDPQEVYNMTHSLIVETDKYEYDHWQFIDDVRMAVLYVRYTESYADKLITQTPRPLMIPVKLEDITIVCQDCSNILDITAKSIEKSDIQQYMNCIAEVIQTGKRTIPDVSNMGNRELLLSYISLQSDIDRTYTDKVMPLIIAKLQSNNIYITYPGDIKIIQDERLNAIITSMTPFINDISINIPTMLTTYNALRNEMLSRKKPPKPIPPPIVPPVKKPLDQSYMIYLALGIALLWVIR